eukprot:scaffold89197_cov61-Cyclotella_meneghiniana.AAC.1
MQKVQLPSSPHHGKLSHATAPPITAASASVQGKASHCRRDSIDCSFFIDIVFCSRSQQPVDKGNGATEHLEVAGIHSYRVSAPATGSNTTNHTSSLLGSCHEGLHVNLSAPNFIAAFHIPNNISLDSRVKFAVCGK